METDDLPGVSRADAREQDFASWLGARQRGLLRTAYLLCGDAEEAHDLVQTVAARLYLAWDRIEDPDAYARRSLANATTSWWRRAFRRHETTTETLPDRGAVAAYDDGTRDALWAHVQTLPPRQRAVVVLRYYEQRSESEIADILGISPGTVKSTASRALASLRDGLPDALARDEEGRR